MSHPDDPKTFSAIRRVGSGRSSAVAVAWLIEITSPPVSTTKFAGVRAVDRAAHRRQAVEPQRQLEVGRFRRQVLAERDLAASCSR